MPQNLMIVPVIKIIDVFLFFRPINKENSTIHIFRN